FSVAGQRPTANAITVDGLSLGGGSVPQDAIRSTRVVTSSYDAARGQFSGGLVASTTRSGKNIPQGSFTYTLRDRSLAWGQLTTSPFGQGYTQTQLSGGMGGPLVRNRLFVFGAVQGRWRGQALPSLASADPLTLARLGVSPDSASRFLALAAASGAPAQVYGFSDERTTDNAVAFLRFDWKVSEAQTLTLRLDGRWDSQQPTRVSPLGLPPTGGTRTERGGGVMASLTSHFAGSLINEVRGYFSVERRYATALRASRASSPPSSRAAPRGTARCTSRIPGAPAASSSRTEPGSNRRGSAARRRTIARWIHSSRCEPTGFRSTLASPRASASCGPVGVARTRGRRSCAVAWATSRARRRPRCTARPSGRRDSPTPRRSSSASERRSRFRIGRYMPRIRPRFRGSARTPAAQWPSARTRTSPHSPAITHRRTRGALPWACSAACSTRSRCRSTRATRAARASTASAT